MGVQSESQVSQGYMVRPPHLKKQNENKDPPLSLSVVRQLQLPHKQATEFCGLNSFIHEARQGSLVLHLKGLMDLVSLNIYPEMS